MSVRRVLAVGFASLSLLGLPASAVAQSAGDDQYVDPLSGITGGGSGSGGRGGGKSDAAGGVGGGSGSDADSAASGLGGVGAGPASGNALPSELARTGTELPVTAAAGLILLAAGFGLRRRAGARD